VKDFVIIDNFFSEDILSELKQYCTSKSTDQKDVGDWKHLTPDVKLISQEELTVNSRLLLSDYVFNKPNTPLYNNKLINKCKAGIYKILKGANLDEHRDNCLISLTVYLSDNWDSKDGGNFYYINSEGKQIIVKNCFNTAIIFTSDENNIKYSHNYPHGFTEITGDAVRYTLQLFVK
jgi:hypothetical protein|tara:strand:+ start:2150 stop:2680 length:531 start_codon:yes stop_codon:yes gene_type:complete